MGEEWAASTPWQFFTDFPDRDLGSAVREGRRAEFSRHGWAAEEIPDPQDPATFERSVLRWAERDTDGHAEVLDWYRALIALRRSEPDVLDDDLRRVGVQHGDDWIMVRRGRIAVLVNLGSEPILAELSGGSRLLLASGSVDALAGRDRWRLGPDAVAILGQVAQDSPIEVRPAP